MLCSELVQGAVTVILLLSFSITLQPWRSIARSCALKRILSRRDPLPITRPWVVWCHLPSSPRHDLLGCFFQAAGWSRVTSTSKEKFQGPKNLKGGRICAARCLNSPPAATQRCSLPAEHSAPSRQPFMVRSSPASNGSSKKWQHGMPFITWPVHCRLQRTWACKNEKKK